MTIDEIRDNFALAGRLGRSLPVCHRTRPHAGADAGSGTFRSQQVQGCASQVWLAKQVSRNSRNEPVLSYLGDSDAHIVRGLIAILLTLFSGRTPQEILAADALAIFDQFGFREHLTPQRSNGLRAMVERIRSDAREALATVS